jgi:hypothetical protein
MAEMEPSDQMSCNANNLGVEDRTGVVHVESLFRYAGSLFVLRNAWLNPLKAQRNSPIGLSLEAAAKGLQRRKLCQPVCLPSMPACTRAGRILSPTGCPD